jgi:peptide/nickel transport system substrate-binding protein
MNNAKAPLDSTAVRQAISYSLDRNAIVKRLFGGIGVTKAAQSLEPALVAAYTDTEAFAGYKKDLDKVTSLMEGDGWAKGSDGIWAKAGQRATIEMKTTAGNARRELTEQIVQQQLKDAGFEITLNNQKAGDLFGQQLPAGEFQLALYAQVLTNIEPGACTLFCSKNIPTEANGNTGQNWTRTNVPAVESDLEQLDTQLDQAKREEAGKTAMKGLAEDVASLPLDPLPNILLWSKKVVGPIQDNPVMGPFFNMNEWGVQS